MKNLRLRSLIVAALFLPATLIIDSCGKDDATPPPAAVFTWTTGGTTFTADNVSASISGPYSILANKDAALASIKSFTIYLSAFTVGAYTLSAAGANQLGYFTSGGIVMSQSGTLNITVNSNGKLGGNFTTTLSGGATMTGDFSNISINP